MGGIFSRILLGGWGIIAITLFRGYGGNLMQRISQLINNLGVALFSQSAQHLKWSFLAKIPILTDASKYS
jgi:hypothetical protein